MAYQPIKIIAEEQTTDGHVNRETSFDSTPQSNKINYQTGLPLITATPKSLGGKGPRRVDMNGLFYLFSSFLFELQQGNYPTFNADVVGAGKPLPDGYPQGAVLWYPTGGYFVRSLVANNTESDLSDINSWAKIAVSAADLASELSGKVDLASGVAQADVDYVIETYVNAPSGYVNGTSWYRVYKSGWCEQGGIALDNAQITFLKPFADSYYCVTGTGIFVDNLHAFVSYELKTPTTMVLRVGPDRTESEYGRINWIARGYLAPQGE